MSDVWLVTCPSDIADRAGHLHGSHAASRRANARLASLESLQSPWLPHRLLQLAPAEYLSAKISVGVEDRCGQIHLVIHGRDVLGRHADFNHLEVLGRLENAVSNSVAAE